MAQNGSISADWILRVANFGLHYLWHFIINFGNSCACLAANFLNFSKHPTQFLLEWFWRELWTKTTKIRNQKICHFKPTQKCNLFWGWDFSIFFLKMAYFMVPAFCGFLSITPFKTIPIKNVGGVLKNSGNLQQNRHKNFQNWWRNVRDNWAQSWQPWKFNQQKLSHFEPPLKSYLFWEWYF